MGLETRLFTSLAGHILRKRRNEEGSGDMRIKFLLAWRPRRLSRTLRRSGLAGEGPGISPGGGGGGGGGGG